MATKPFVVDQFSGLNLANDPQEIGASGAVDLLNVRTDRRDRIHTRDGYTLYSTPSSTPPLVGIGYGTQFVIACGNSGSNAQALASNGTSVAVATFAASSLARFGTPAASRVYAAGTAANSYGYFDGAAWNLVVGGVPARRIAVTPWDSRMAAVQSSKINFSDAGDANTFGASNFIQLTPGDNESLTGLCSWRELLFAAKQTKFFVFYGTSTDGTGNPIFNYRTVDAGVGAVDAQTITMAPGRDAVYMLAKDGVYATTGGVPVKISAPLDPWFNGDQMPAKSFATFTGAFTGATIGSVGDYVFVSPEPEVSAVTFVYHVPTTTWLAYDWRMQMCAASPYGGANGPETMISLTSDDKLYRHSSAWTTDNGSAISWSWTSGMFSPVSNRGDVAISLESQLVGSGTATLQVATTGGVGSSSGAFDTGSSVTMGTAPALAEGWQQVDREGALWQHKLSGSGVATVAGLSHYMSSVKPSGVW